MSQLFGRTRGLVAPVNPNGSDVGSDSSHSWERYRRATFTAAAALAARGLNLVTTLVMVPLTLGYLGAERYGMWMTISSLIALLSLTDLGIGNGLMNAIAHAHGTGNRQDAARKVSSALVMLALVAAFLGLAFALSYSLVPWAHLFSVTSVQAQAEAAPATAAWVACFLIGLPLSIAAQVRNGYQEGYMQHMVSILASLAAVTLLVLAIAGRQSLPVLVLAVASPPVVAAVSNSGLVFWRRYPWLRPSWRQVDVRSVVSLLRVGVLFFVLQISIALAFTSDTLITARILGPVAVAEYAVSAKLFMVPTAIVAAMFSALWPAYRESISRGDVTWARRTLTRSLRVGLLITIPSAVLLVVFGLWLIHLWVGDEVQPPFLLVLGFGVWIILNGLGTSVAMFLNGAQEIRAQAGAAIVMAIANITVSIWLAGRIGVAGVIWGTVITYGLFVLVPMTLYLPSVFRKIELQRLKSSNDQVADSTQRLDDPPQSPAWIV